MKVLRFICHETKMGEKGRGNGGNVKIPFIWKQLNLVEKILNRLKQIIIMHYFYFVYF